MNDDVIETKNLLIKLLKENIVQHGHFTIKCNHIPYKNIVKVQNKYFEIDLLLISNI